MLLWASITAIHISCMGGLLQAGKCHTFLTKNGEPWAGGGVFVVPSMGNSRLAGGVSFLPSIGISELADVTYLSSDWEHSDLASGVPFLPSMRNSDWGNSVVAGGASLTSQWKTLGSHMLYLCHQNRGNSLVSLGNCGLTDVLSLSQNYRDSGLTGMAFLSLKMESLSWQMLLHVWYQSGNFRTRREPCGINNMCIFHQTWGVLRYTICVFATRQGKFWDKQYVYLSPCHNMCSCHQGGGVLG